jgi:hypothetical protein
MSELALPISDKNKVSVNINENINFLSINRGFIRLLENDKYLLANLSDVYTTVSNNSADWAYIVSGDTANWDSVYATVSNNSASWEFETLSGYISTAVEFLATGNGANIMPVGTTEERPESPVVGMYRKNTTTGKPEWYDPIEDKWRSFASEDEDELPSYKCRAWVNFNGTLTSPTIRASANVSHVVRHGVGDYTIHFIVPMPDPHFAITGSCEGTTHKTRSVCRSASATLSVSSIRISTGVSGGAKYGGRLEDSAYVYVAIFR